jgi:cytochrome b
MSSATEQSTEVQEGASKREIGHDDFNPVGTLVLITIYFLIIAALWLFMYFFEFLGRGPTVV